MTHPLSKLVNIAKTFLQLVTKNFPKSNKFDKIFKRNTVKVSYSCMNSMPKIIKGHNNKVTSKPHDQTQYNCRENAECSMEENYQVNEVFYKCDVTRPLLKKVYLGLAEGEWKNHFYNHKLLFKNKRYFNKTTLSSYM